MTNYYAEVRGKSFSNITSAWIYEIAAQTPKTLKLKLKYRCYFYDNKVDIVLINKPNSYDRVYINKLHTITAYKDTFTMHIIYQSDNVFEGMQQALTREMKSLTTAITRGFANSQFCDR